MNYEMQPSGLNPEWEANKEQNIAIAKRIDSLLLGLPNPPLFLKGMEEANIPMSGEGFRRFIDFLKRGDPADKKLAQAETLEDLAFLVEEDKLTTGFSIRLTHIDNGWRHIYLKVGWNREFTDFMAGADLELVPKNFNFPAYGIQIGTNNIYDHVGVTASSIYGDFQNDIIGDDGLYHRMGNAYCFNFFWTRCKDRKCNPNGFA